MREPNTLDKIPRDKLLHTLIGVVVFAISSVLWQLAGTQSYTLLSVLVTASIGFGIEIYQNLTKTGDASLGDARATLIGGLIGAICTITI